ncbi:MULTISPECIES: hypothetical protein [Bacillus cereus group]|uniref:Uncharacterized protein n=1 Tax=Bacillus cereus HuA3-9 TaxID=1053205 RepID=R8CDF8_BACCE|nr:MULTISPECIES: hypothetical protein [Bacillus cereus group]EOO09646.1 hypothetical protein IGA_06255 [Bacillus cereus HuA3-9]
MKYEHAITLDKPVLSIGEIISIFQKKEITEPIRSRELTIFQDTVGIIGDQMKEFDIDYYGYRDFIMELDYHDCNDDCDFEFQRRSFEYQYGNPCEIEDRIQEWGHFLIKKMESKKEVVKSEYRRPSTIPPTDEEIEQVEYNKRRAIECSELFHIPYETLKAILKESPHTVIEIIQNIELENTRILEKLPAHLGVQFAYKEELKELYIYYGEKHLPGIYRLLLLLKIFEFDCKERE